MPFAKAFIRSELPNASGQSGTPTTRFPSWSEKGIKTFAAS